jgi:hypothetical protein
MAVPINAAALAALADEPLDWRFKGMPVSWWGRTPAQIRASAPNLHEEGDGQRHRGAQPHSLRC